MPESSDVLLRNDALHIISKSSVYGNLGLFIGAGMSMAILNSKGKEVALSWKQLIYKCADEFNINLGNDIKTEGLSYPEIASEIAKQISIAKTIDYNSAIKLLKEEIAKLTCWYPEKDSRELYEKIILDIAPSWIITTNYDLIIECLLSGNCLSLGPNDQLISPQNLIPIYHLHGIRTNPDSIIISQEDYISLFRPNQYRQQKLTLSIKESTTLIIGYGIGDVNVLTAVDWSKNVYYSPRINYPHDIVQLLYTNNPKIAPYRDKNNILIVEFNNLESILSEIAGIVVSEKEKIEVENNQLDLWNNYFSNSDKTAINKFIDDSTFRLGIINAVEHYNTPLISGFLVLFTKAIEETWKRAEPYGAFHAYDENLKILLDIIEKIEIDKLPPALLESIAYNLNSVSFLIGKSSGKSRAAYKTWTKRKENIPENTRTELMNIGRVRDYGGLNDLWSK